MGLNDGLASKQLIVTDMISGLNVYASASGVSARINDSAGALFASRTGSATTQVFGTRIQTGSTLTGAEGFGSAIFSVPFANTSYFWTAQTGSTGVFLATDAGSWAVTISGINGRNTSGVVFKGGASMPYTWVAIGLV